MSQNNSKNLYPTIARRIKAVLIDSLFFTIILIGVWPFLASFEIKSNVIRISLMLLPFLILEPVLVSFTGGTIGHHIFKIRIKHSKKDKNINLIMAIIRFFVKSVLGLISFLMILLTKKHQAIHDYLSDSVVILKNPTMLSAEEALPERILKEDGYKYPSILRRIIIIFIYSIIVYILPILIVVPFISQPCIDNDFCSKNEELLMSCTGLFIFILWLAVLVMGFRSQLWGCRKKTIIDK